MYKIITEPNEILHKRASRVGAIDSSIRLIVDEMYETMKKANGVGLAAPQVDLDKQIAIVEIPEQKEKNIVIEEATTLIALINPKIIDASPTEEKHEEGCLSIPGFEVEVSRPTWVVVEYTNLDSKIVKLRADRVLGRAIQHEIDHLNGILITDHGQAKPIKND